MTSTQRICLNIVASYGRSVFALVCGLFSTRWILMALGQTDLGLYSLIGSLTLLISFYNTQFALAIGRFFAYSIGQATVSNDPKGALEECRKWFNVAVGIHTLIPVILMLAGYPIGHYLIVSGYFQIPPEKLNACVWIWRFSCASCFAAMVNVPFQGMFTAKQCIAELTFYSVLQTAVRTVAAFYMASCPQEWLFKYALFMMLLSVVPQLIICLRAVAIFPECRFVSSYVCDLKRVMEVLVYVVWQTFGSSGYVARTSGVAVLVNRIFGPSVNAAMGIGNTLASETAVLTGAISGAFSPAITTACGAGDFEYVKVMAYRTCKFGTLMTLVFAIPLALEVEEVLALWLKEPPPYAAELCLGLLFCVAVEKMTLGHTIAINASGRLAVYQILHGLSLAAVLPVGVLACILWKSVWSIGGALMVSMVLSVVSDVVVSQYVLGMRIIEWMKTIVRPILIVSFIGTIAGVIPLKMMNASLVRVLITSLFSAVSFLTAAWFWVMSVSERAFVEDRVNRFWNKAKSY